MEIRKRVPDLFEKFGMPGESQRRLGTFSKGMRQKVGLIRSMLHNPAVLLLDEPTSAMDPYSARLVRDAIQLLRRDQRSIILCTHNLAEAEELADRIALISRGQIVCIGTAAELKSEVLGKPQYELRLNRAIRLELGHLDSVADVEVLENGAVIRYRTEKATTANPLLVQRITELGAGILSLQQLPQSLEDVYLKILRREAQEAPNGGRR
jgi:ABC-2 type transport system ATP-binding protein